MKPKSKNNPGNGTIFEDNRTLEFTVCEGDMTLNVGDTLTVISGFTYPVGSNFQVGSVYVSPSPLAVKLAGKKVELYQVTIQGYE